MRQEQQLQKLRARQEKQHAAQTKKEETTSLLPSLEVDKFSTYPSMLIMIYFRLLLIFVWKKKYQLLPLGGPSPPYLTPPSACPGWRLTGPGPGCRACPGCRWTCPWPGCSDLVRTDSCVGSEYHNTGTSYSFNIV